MAGTFTNIDVGQKVFDMNSGQWSEHIYSMVKLNLDSSNYVTSPYITVDESVASLQESAQYRFVCTSLTAEAGWYWYKNDVGQSYATEAALLQHFGLEFHYPTATPTVSKELGDEVIITKTDEYSGCKIEASYTRRGAILEVDCPLIQNTIPSLPYVGIDANGWANGDPRFQHSDGTYVFTYDIDTSPINPGWIILYNRSTLVAQLSDAAINSIYGITIFYPDETASKMDGDTITVIKSTDETTGELHFEYIYAREDSNLPSAQKLCNEIFVAIQGLGYQPLHADNAIINPAAEIGDTLTICEVTSGLYYQETTFNRLMASNVGAPVSSESDPEMEYESKQDRNYARKFADIAAEFNIQADQISAKVSKTSPTGQSSFSWELYDDHWAVKHNDVNMLYINSEGSQFTGKVMANQIAVDTLTIGGQEIPAGWIQGNAAGDANQIAYGTIGGGSYGNLSFGEVGVALDNVIGAIQTSLGWADDSHYAFFSNARVTYINADYGTLGQLTYNGWDVRWSTVNIGGVPYWILTRDYS